MENKIQVLTRWQTELAEMREQLTSNGALIKYEIRKWRDTRDGALTVKFLSLESWNQIEDVWYDMLNETRIPWDEIMRFKNLIRTKIQTTEQIVSLERHIKRLESKI